VPGRAARSLACGWALDDADALCENRTVNTNGAAEVLDFGQRIAQGRLEADMTQAGLAEAVGLDRTAIAKLEAGSRKVSATELVAIAAAVDRPIDWFVTESPPAVISRRSDAAAGGHSRRLDLAVERLARDVAFLVDQKVLSDASARPSLELPVEVASAEALAGQARVLMELPDGPLLDLQRAAERVGLLAFSQDLGETGKDAAYVEVANVGVALVNGHADPGRRRFNLAHELGHHLFGDAYAPEVAINASDETERLINAFAVHLLLPRREVTETWAALGDLDPRLAAVSVSFTFRASWTATCNQLRTLGLLDDGARSRFVATRPTAADAVALGERWVSELDSPAVPPEYGRRVMAGYENGKLSAARTVELLWGTVGLADLPEQRPMPLESLRRDLEPLQ
jgi:Zn-dependent peptidase ImmA (M78 family)/DNA-binding XRE family transcriptional regulator